MSKKLSIIMPVYMGEKFIEKTLMNVLSQTYENFELLCIIDGSTDNSANIIEKHAQNDPRIIIYEKENGGVASARNFGLDKARGDYIAFFDQDDCAESEMYSALISKMEAENSDAAFCNALVETEEGTKPLLGGKSEPVFEKGYYRDSKIIANLWTCVYKKEIIDKYNLRFLKNMQIGEDLDFTYRYSLVAEKTSFVNKDFYCWVIHSDNNTFDSDKRVSVYHCFKNMFDFTEKFSERKKYKYNLKVLDQMFRDYIIEYSIFTLPKDSRKETAKIVKKLVSEMKISAATRFIFHLKLFVYEHPRFMIIYKLKKEFDRVKKKLLKYK